ncbi:MAG: glycosyl hydrolase 108 family protein [Candidatus Competibacteraceae bacterium]
MGDFHRCIDPILAEEGGLSNHPDDPGRLTKYGISQRSYPTLGVAKTRPMPGKWNATAASRSFKAKVTGLSRIMRQFLAKLRQRPHQKQRQRQ